MRKRRIKDSQALTTWVPASLRRRLSVYCLEREGQLQDFIRVALEEAFRKKSGR